MKGVRIVEEMKSFVKKFRKNLKSIANLHYGRNRRLGTADFENCVGKNNQTSKSEFFGKKSDFLFPLTHET